MESIRHRQLPVILCIGLVGLILSPHFFGSTSAAPGAAACGWPDEADNDLPMGGLFYGHHLMGEQTGNGILFGYEASRRFRAERTGQVTSVRHNNRTLLQQNIDGRCRDGNIWCECVEGGLDLLTCGYHLSNSYSLGNGGLVTVEIHADDGTAEHLPTGTPLGVISDPYVPLDLADVAYPIFDLASPVTLQAGCIYHVVYRQLNPPMDCRRRGGYSVEDAAGCDRERGLIGLNGISFADNEDRGPWLGRTAAILTRHSPDEDWQTDRDNLSWLEIGYADGVWTGDAYTYNDGAGTARVAGGALQIRQRFTVRDADRSVDGVWLRAGRRTAVDAGALQVELREQGQTAGATGTFAAAEFEACTTTCGSWAFAPFDRAMQLKVGTGYTVTFSAPDNAQYVMTTGFPIDYSPYDSKSRNIWNDSGAQYSEDAGATWTAFTGSYHPDRDLSLLFTIVGMPRSLPPGDLQETSEESRSWGQIKAEHR